MRLANWKYLKSGLSGLAAIAGLAMLSYAPASSAEAITGTWGAGTSFNATGKSASLTLFSTVDANGTSTTNPFSTLNDLSPFNGTFVPNKSRVEVWAFRSPFGGYPQGGNILLRWDPTLGGSKTPSLALPALPDGSYYLAVLGLVNQTGVTITNEPNCRWKNSNLNDLTSGDTQYCNFAVQLFDNLIGSLNCSSGSCTTSTAEPVGNIVPQTGGWWRLHHRSQQRRAGHRCSALRRQWHRHMVYRIGAANRRRQFRRTVAAICWRPDPYRPLRRTDHRQQQCRRNKHQVLGQHKRYIDPTGWPADSDNAVTFLGIGQVGYASSRRPAKEIDRPLHQATPERLRG